MVDGYILPGRAKAFWVTTLTDPANPSATEVNAGTEITPALRGIPDYPRTGQVADDADLSSRVNKQKRGTIDLGDVSLTMKRTTATETEYSAINEGDAGYLVIFRKGTAGASPASGDVADVLTVECNTKSPRVPGRNDVDISDFTFIQTEDQNLDVTLAA